MRVTRLLGIVTTVLVVLTACPLPYDFSGEGAGSNVSSDPSSPNVTSPVTISYSESGGADGTIENGAIHVSGTTTTVTLSTATENAVIYYTDDGSEITNFAGAIKINDSSGSITVSRTTGAENRNIHAVAVGSGMLPSPPVQGIITVTPFPVLTVSADDAAIPEDGGATAFRVTSSRAPDVDLAIALTTGGDYEAGDIFGLGEAPGGPGSSLVATLAAGTTSVVLPFSSAGDPEDSVDDTVTLTIEPGSDYSVGSPASASVVILDNQVIVPELTLSVDRTTMTDAQIATFTIAANVAPNQDITVSLGRTGIDGTWVNQVYTNLTFPAGATAVTFTLDPIDSIGFEQQVGTYTLQSGTGYTVGTPNSRTVTVVDDVLGAFTYIGFWDFVPGQPSPVGTQAGVQEAGNVGYAAVIGRSWVDIQDEAGAYDEITMNLSNSLADLDKDNFTIAFRFSLRSFRNPGAPAGTTADRSLFAGGRLYRWMRLGTSGLGEVMLDFNNGDQRYVLDTLPTVNLNTYYTVVAQVDVAARSTTVNIGGPTYSAEGVTLPDPAPGDSFWEVENAVGPTAHEEFVSSDRASATDFDGLYEWVLVVNGQLTPGEMESLVTSLQP
jgi:hypothetical protein